MLQARAASRHAKSRAPGTFNNRNATVREYLGFSYTMKFSPQTPTYQELTAYMEFSMMRAKSPRTMANKIAHIRVYMKDVGADLKPFFHPKVLSVLEGIKRDKTYIPRPKIPMPMTALRRVVQALGNDKPGRLQAAIILVIYHAALRQSDLLPPAVSLFDYTYHLTRGDVRLLSDFGMLRLKGGKTLQHYDQTREVTIHAAPQEMYCPLVALKRVIQDTPTLSPRDPMFMFPDSRAPVPTTYMNGIWAKVLDKLNIQKAPFSLHSLRKAAATEASRAGCSDQDIQQFGGWTSDAYKAYIYKQPQTSVQAAVSAAIYN